MAVTVKSARELGLMRDSGKILAEVHAKLGEFVKPGISTLEIDQLGEKLIRGYDCVPNFLHYNGYPASICVSVNDEVVHGIPHKEHFLDEGDIVSLDAGVIYKGYHSDAARTYGIGEIDDDAKKLIEVTRQSFFEGIRFAREGHRLLDISAAIQAYVESHGYSVVREYVGHGVGAQMHEAPEIPNYGHPGRGPRLLRGMTLAIEPMVNAGSAAIQQLSDGWTVKTLDGKWAAHYENTILITEGDAEVLTVTEDGAYV